jgi:hypothetical protein
MKEEDLFKKSRMVVAGGLAVVVATAGVAAAGDTGADLNDAEVVSKVTPSKLSKKKFTKINVQLGVVNSPDSAGNEDANAAAERIAWSKNIKVNLNKAPKCNVDLPNAIPTENARDLCPPKSVIGTGQATVHAPGATCTPPQADPCLAGTQVVTVFNGHPTNGPGALQLHTWGDPPEGLGGLSPTVDAWIEKANQQEKNKGFGQVLDVPIAPTTGALKITSFNAKIKKSSKVATARCKPKKFKTQRTVTYTDGSSETATETQKCKVKK